MSTFSTGFTARNAYRALAAAVLGLLIVMSDAVPATASGLQNRCGNAAVNSPSDFCSANIQYLSDGLARYALLAAVVGICISAALWALGSKGQNPGQELTGKRGLIVCAAAAFCIGGVGPYMTKLQSYAQNIDNPSAGANSGYDEFGNWGGEGNRARAEAGSGSPGTGTGTGTTEEFGSRFGEEEFGSRFGEEPFGSGPTASGLGN